MRRRRAARGLLAGLLVISAGAVAACSGVPSSSRPEVVTPINVDQPSPTTTITPQPGDSPPAIVQGFLDASAADDPHHNAARAFLTPDVRNRWSDSTVTIVDDLTSPLQKPGHTVTVSGNILGSIDATGVYTPVLQGDGSGEPQPFPFSVTVGPDQQWRISDLPSPSGLLINESTFTTLFRSYNLYFSDAAGQHLIADPRYTSISDPEALSTWLVEQLTSGPQQNLQRALTAPPPALGPRVSVDYTTGTTTIQIPGASQLDDTTRDNLATQLALTLDQVVSGQEFQITDGGRPVFIPAVRATQFTADAISTNIPEPTSAPSLYYLRGNRLVDQTGRPVPGPVGNGQYPLTSVALADQGTQDLRVAGTVGTGTDTRLMIGTMKTGLRQVNLPPGKLSRPTWAPGLNEVWVGDGHVIKRISGSGQAVTVPFATPTGAPGGQVTAVRLSPDGSRVAMVVMGAGTAQILIGIVVRNASGVRVDNLEPISPLGVAAVDMAWLPQPTGEDKLFLIGRNISSGITNVYDVQMDGSSWTDKGRSNLPGPPDSITIAEASLAWVSADDTVWKQSASAWSSPTGSSTAGTKPVYVE